ncbi:MAG: DUF134 domain-containing protein, partial [Lentisphaerae bacterium]|nr:DUF134 domain-containing protein [Lentisphaerota bacterium]MCP4102392.1 DUF134 domain-containing protein [Lentisphaerota bacterium]
LRLLSEVVLKPDEFEAIKLSDFEEMYQADAAKKMGVSRQTFGNIIKLAHIKIADALIGGKAIRIEGKIQNISEGNVFECADCNYSWQPEKPGQQNCPKCNSENIHKNISYYPGRGRRCCEGNQAEKKNIKEVVMPGRDGTEPMGKGSRNSGDRGMKQGGKGKMGGAYSAGPGGNCICPSCGYKNPHIAGQPCSMIECPECNVKMTRK